MKVALLPPIKLCTFAAALSLLVSTQPAAAQGGAELIPTYQFTCVPRDAAISSRYLLSAEAAAKKPNGYSKTVADESEFLDSAAPRSEALGGRFEIRPAGKISGERSAVPLAPLTSGEISTSAGRVSYTLSSPSGSYSLSGTGASAAGAIVPSVLRAPDGGAAPLDCKIERKVVCRRTQIASGALRAARCGFIK